MLVQAPAGYGKSTFAAQWCRRDPRPTAWLGLRDADNDPIHLLSRVMTALEAVESRDPAFVEDLSLPSPNLDRAIIRLLQSWERRAPVQVVFDEVHLLRRPSAIRILRSLAEAVPAESQVVLVTRTDPPFGLARMRMAGDLYEVRVAALALDRAETDTLLRQAGVAAGVAEVDQLWQQTEGWAAVVGLAAMSGRGANGSESLPSVSGTQRDIADYLWEEVLSHEPDDVRHFLLATSLTQRLCGDVCDAMLGRKDSGRVLRDLATVNLFIVPLDEQRRWYRYHHLFQELLQAELVRSTEDPVEYLDRAAAWHEAHGEPSEAFDYSRRCGDLGRAGRVLMRHWNSYAARGRIETLLLWLDRCKDEDIESDPQLAIGAAWVTALSGDVARAHRYLAAAERGDLDHPSPDGATTLRAAMLNLRASLAPSGVGQMLADGLAVIESERTTRTRWLVGGYRTAGIAHLMLGDARAAVAALSETLPLTEGQPELQHVRVFCLGMLAVAHTDLNEWGRAESYLRDGDSIVARYDEAVQGLPILLMRASLHARNGDRGGTLAAIDKARAVLPTGWGPACLGAELTLRCAQATHLVGAEDLAKEFLELSYLAARRAGDAGTVVHRLNDLSASMTGVDRRVIQLTPAEMRVLRQLATHRTLKQIAEHLYVSRATVKTHVGSIYAKLGVTSRADAVALLAKRDAPLGKDGA